MAAECCCGPLSAHRLLVKAVLCQHYSLHLNAWMLRHPCALAGEELARAVADVAAQVFHSARSATAPACLNPQHGTSLWHCMASTAWNGLLYQAALPCDCK